MFDHQGSKFRAVNKDEARVYAVCVVPGVGAETRRRDEDAATCLSSVQCSDEGLDVGAADMTVGVPLGLDVDNIETEGIKADEAIEAHVAWGTEVLRGCLQAPIAHLDKKPQDQLFKEGRGLLDDSREQVGRHRRVRRVDDVFDSFTGGEVFAANAVGPVRWLTFALLSSTAKFLVLWELTQDRNVHPVRVLF